jgi:hypothetical protein
MNLQDNASGGIFTDQVDKGVSHKKIKVLHTEAYFSLMMYMYPSPPEKGARGLRAVWFHPSPFPSPLPSEGRGDSGSIVLENNLQPE